MKPLNELLATSAALHQHLCPRQVLGVRMGLWAGELLRLDLPQRDKQLLTIVEIDGCFADGVAVATNCWVGRRTLRVEDYGKVAATFVDLQTKRSLRLTPYAQARDLVCAYAPEANSKWEAMLLGYQRMAPTELFAVEWVELLTPPDRIVSHPGRRVTCVCCGEEINNERECLLAGAIFCRTCAGQGYYRPYKSDPTDVYSVRQPLRVEFASPSSTATTAKLAERRARQLLTVLEVSQEITAQLDLAQVLQSITNRVGELLQAQAVLLCLLQPNGQTLELVASKGWSGTALGTTQAVCHGLTLQVIGEGQTIQIAPSCAACQVLGGLAPGFCHATPLRIGETTLGALCLIYDPDKPLAPDQRQSLQLLANAAAIAINNARLTEAAQQETARAAASAEREQLAAELHDHLAQTLSLLNLKVDRLHELLVGDDRNEVGAILAQMKTTVTTAYMQVRHALTGLRQPGTTSTDLIDKLATCLAEFRVNTGIATELSVADSVGLALAPVTQTQFIQIVREVLTNVQRHAQARQVCVQVEQAGDMLGFTLLDDGCGFDAQATLGDHHLGLKIMKMRAERSGGSLHVQSAPGAGTKVVVQLPAGR